MNSPRAIAAQNRCTTSVTIRSENSPSHASVHPPRIDGTIPSHTAPVVGSDSAPIAAAPRPTGSASRRPARYSTTEARMAQKVPPSGRVLRPPREPKKRSPNSGAAVPTDRRSCMLHKRCVGSSTRHLLSRRDANLARLNERPASRGKQVRAIPRRAKREALTACRPGRRSVIVTQPLVRRERPSRRLTRMLESLERVGSWGRQRRGARRSSD